MKSRGLGDVYKRQEQVTGEKHLTPLAAVVASEWFLTEEGKANVFDL